MLGLYVHIPFCARRCPYCDFAIQVAATEALRAEYVAVLSRELEGALREEKRALTSIYFGGGTPTELSDEQLSGLLKLIFETIEVVPSAEITIEANPENLSDEKLAALRAAGFNRLSLGAQNFDEAALHLLGRRHAPQTIEDAIARARRAGWENVSLDLIYAVPGQSREAWRETLRRAASLKIEHVSCYSLTIESGTPFARRAADGRLIPVSDDVQADLMSDATEILGEAGIERYEVSNYARRGRESAHNLNYWRGGDYLAAGCGAHGHRSGHRWWNERAARRYIEKMRELGTARVGEEFLQTRERLSEIVLLGLRLREGIALEAASQRLNCDVRGALRASPAWRTLTEQGYLHEDKDILRLNPAAWPVADAIAARLLSE
jgi:putative oxygen-independent coproporphyrinogen III oxidase